MANVADLLWEMLEKAGVQRCYGIVGDALNPVIDALRRNGKIEFVHVRHEEYGVFAAVADAYFTGRPVAVCGTAGPGVTHLFNGLIDATKEGAPVIAIAGDVERALIDTAALEELNPYKFFDAAALYVGRIVEAAQARPVDSRSFAPLRMTSSRGRKAGQGAGVHGSGRRRARLQTPARV
jgi:pyruvate dehydrogenase (quinone)